MVRTGTPERVAMKISGHKTRAVFDRYNIVNEEDLKATCERLSNAYEEIKETISQAQSGTSTGTIAFKSRIEMVRENYKPLTINTMRERGLEPLWCYPLDPKSSASASSATLACLILQGFSFRCQTIPLCIATEL